MSDDVVVKSGPVKAGYRPALDGLRAVAVLVVIAYHVEWLRGGFLGVDVFFVLSGYLITALLLREFAATRAINLAGFWARRARRLLPAVLLLVGVFLIELHLIPSESAALGARRGDIFSTLFYYANWHFISSDQSYFDAFLGVSPLRHMWSLAIEEQFYLVWPLLVLVAVRFVSNRSVLLGAVVLGAIASSVAMTLYFDPTDPSRSYFGTDTRAHVLLAGAALAILAHYWPAMMASTKARRVAQASWPVAMTLVLVTFVALGDQHPIFYRGGSLAFACLVALALWAIEVVPTSLPARALSVGPMRYVGRISYGLYLWHWPLIIWFATFVRVSNVGQKLLAILATFIMATISFYLVERPIRQGSVPWLRLSKARLAVVAPLSLVLVAVLTLKVTSSRTLLTSETPCPPGSPSAQDLRWCVQFNPRASDPPVVVTAGDSTSRSLSPGLHDVATRRSWRYIQAGQNGCSFLRLDLVSQWQGCKSRIPDYLTNVAKSASPDVWIVSDLFGLSPLRRTDGAILEGDDPRRVAIVEDALRDALTQLTSKGGKVVLIETPPKGAPERCGATTTGPICGDDAFGMGDRERSLLASIYRRVAAENPGRVAYITVSDILCDADGRCPALVDGTLARYDGVHYTTEFSRRIVPEIVRRAESAGVSFQAGNS